MVASAAAWQPLAAQSNPHAVPPARVTTSVHSEVADLIARGDKASAARHPAQALALYEQALQRDSLSFGALWRASRELVDLGEYEPDRKTQAARYERANRYARQALAMHPEQADVHFHVARAIGRTAMSASSRDRVKYAVSIRDHAMEALARDPKHPGALHIMGVWNAEVMRLNGIARAFAKTFMGGKVLGSASWAEAVRYMEEAVAHDPQRTIHRLDQARIYRDMGRIPDARAAYQAALKSPFIDANDERYHRAAEDELKALK
jgi:tetratricopeptide (TPR) repeat protein